MANWWEEASVATSNVSSGNWWEEASPIGVQPPIEEPAVIPQDDPSFLPMGDGQSFQFEGDDQEFPIQFSPDQADAIIGGEAPTIPTSNWWEEATPTQQVSNIPRLTPQEPEEQYEYTPPEFRPAEEPEPMGALERLGRKFMGEDFAGVGEGNVLQGTAATLSPFSGMVRRRELAEADRIWTDDRYLKEMEDNDLSLKAYGTPIRSSMDFDRETAIRSIKQKAKDTIERLRGFEYEKEERGASFLGSEKAGWITEGLEGAVDMVPYMAKIATGWVGIPMEIATQFEERRAGRADVDKLGEVTITEDQAGVVESALKSSLSAVSEYYIEKFTGKALKGAGSAIGKTKAGKAILSSKGTKAISKLASKITSKLKSKTPVANIVKTLKTKTGLGNIAEEIFLEEGAQMLVDSAFNLHNMKDDEGNDLGGIRNIGARIEKGFLEFVKQIPQMGVSFGLFGIGGAAVNQSVYKKNKNQIKNALIEDGFTPDQAEQVVSRKMGQDAWKEMMSIRRENARGMSTAEHEAQLTQMVQEDAGLIDSRAEMQIEEEIPDIPDEQTLQKELGLTPEQASEVALTKDKRVALKKVMKYMATTQKKKEEKDLEAPAEEKVEIDEEIKTEATRIHQGGQGLKGRPRTYSQEGADSKPNGYWYGFGESWNQFVDEAGMKPNEGNTYEVSVKPEAKILKIESSKDIAQMHKDGYFKNDYNVDWNKVKEDYDGMEIKNFLDIKAEQAKKEQEFEGYRMPMFVATWDADSGVVWNTDKLSTKEIKQESQQEEATQPIQKETISEKQESAIPAETTLKEEKDPFVEDVVDSLGDNVSIEFKKTERADTIALDTIEVREGDRGKGIGTQAMKNITSLADKHGKNIVISADDNLIDFYKNHGFESVSDQMPGFMVREAKQKEVKDERKDTSSEIQAEGRVGDISKDEEDGGRLIRLRQSRGDSEADSLGRAVYSRELARTREFKDIEERAKPLGLKVVPVQNKDGGALGVNALYDPELKTVFISRDLPKGLTHLKVFRHEAFHRHVEQGNKEAIAIRDQVDVESKAFQSYQNTLKHAMEKHNIDPASVGLETEEDFKEEFAADFFGSMLPSEITDKGLPKKKATKKLRADLKKVEQAEGVIYEDQNVSLRDDGSINPQTDKASLNTYEESKIRIIKAWNKMGPTRDRLSREKLDNYYKQLDNVARIVNGNRDLYDFDSNEIIVQGKTPKALGALRDNSDPAYELSLDFTTMCKRRYVMVSSIEAVQAKLDRPLNADEIMYVRDLLMREGITVSCGACYVESRRLHLKTVVDKATKGFWTPSKDRAIEMDGGKKKRKVKPYKQKDKVIDTEYWVPPLKVPAELFLTTEGYTETMPKEYPAEYAKFRKLFGGTQMKIQEARTEYHGEIARLTKARVQKMNRASGLRWQSWSDFEVVHLLDGMEAIGDMAMVGLAGQAYTKEFEFVDVFGGTGMAINMSLIPKGDGLYKGNLIFNKNESFPWDKAMKNREKYLNVGTEAIGVTDAHIKKLLADPRIDFVIPYHASGLSAKYRQQAGMFEWTDYTEEEGWTDLKTGKALANKNMHRRVFINECKGDLNTFKKLCKERQVEPPFKRMMEWPGYMKLITDRRFLDPQGKFIPQKPVQPIFDTKAINRVMKKYTGTDAEAHKPTVNKALRDIKKGKVPKASLRLDYWEEQDKIKAEKKAKKEETVEDVNIEAEEQKSFNTTSLTKADIKALREHSGYKEAAQSQRKTFEETALKAKQARLDERAFSIAQEILNKSRLITDEEYVGMVLRVAQLQNQKDEYLDQSFEYNESGAGRLAKPLKSLLNGIEKELDIITEAADRTNSLTGRALSVRRLRIDRDNYTVAALEKKVSAMKGGKLSKEERFEIKQMAEKIAEQEKTIKRLEKEAREKAVKQYKKDAEGKIDSYQDRGRTRKGRLDAKAKQKKADILKQARDFGMHLHDITGLPLEAMDILRQLGELYVENGVRDLIELQRLVRADVPTITYNGEDFEVEDVDVYASFSGWNKPEREKVLDEIEQAMKDLKSQARKLSEINEILEKGARKKKKRAPISEENEILRKALKDLRDASRIAVMDKEKLDRTLAKIDSIQDQVENAYRNILEPVRPDTEDIKEAKEKLKDITNIRDAMDVIADLEEQLRTGNLKNLKRKDGYKMSDELQKLKKRITELRQEKKDIIRLDQFKRKVARVQEMLRTGEREAIKQRREDSKEIAAVKRELKELRDIMNTQDEIADLKKQKETGEYKIPVKREVRIISEELRQARVEKNKLLKEARGYIKSKEKMTLLDYPKEVLTSLSRTALATADMSGVLRQGVLLSVNSPKAAGKFFRDAWRSAFDNNSAEEIDYALKEGNKEKQYWRDRYGLYLASLNDSPNSKEEMFTSRILDKTKGLKAIKDFSERHMVTYLNLIRANTFDTFRDNHPGLTDAEYEAMARYINNATGRGSLGKLAPAGNILSYIFFAPKFVASRFVTPWLIVPALFKGHKAVARHIGKELAVSFTTGLTIMWLAGLAGALPIYDPDDPDFGKIIVGKRRFDIWGGFLQPVRLYTRIVRFLMGKRGMLKDEDGELNLDHEDPLTLFSRFWSYKLAPLPQMVLTGIRGKNVVGEPEKPWQTLWRSYLPIVMQAAIESAVEKEKEGLAGIPFEFFGGSSSLYGGEFSSQDIKQVLRKADYLPSKPKMPQWLRLIQNANLRAEIEDRFEEMVSADIREYGLETKEEIAEAAKERRAEIKEWLEDEETVKEFLTLEY